MEYFQVEKEKEARSKTMAFIESKRNWDAKSQKFKIPEAENCTANISDCKIYWRGEYLILEHNGIVHYWDSWPYCFLKQAVEFIQPEKPAKWKTIDKLISLRAAIRQTEVNQCGYVDALLVGEQMTLSRYESFMKQAREQDLQHHGSNTF